MAVIDSRRFLDKVGADRSCVELAQERIRTIFDRFDHVAVAFSGGKDSTVVLNLTLLEAERRGRVPLDVVFYDEEAVAPETEEYVRRVASKPWVSLRWFCLPIRHVNACAPSSPWWFPWAPEAMEKWVRPLPPEAIIAVEQMAAAEGIKDTDGVVSLHRPSELTWHNFPVWPESLRPQIAEYAPALFPPELGTVAYVMGIRADESMTRLRAVTRRLEDNWLVHYHSPWNAGNVTKCYPIYDWRTTDVWTAPQKFGWDYNRAYDLQEMHGFHGARQRIAPPFGAEPMQMLGMYATCWPELWEGMCERVPGARTAARYSRTELYSFRARPEPAPGETWKELITRLIQRHAPETQAKVKQRISDEIDWHYRKTNGAKTRQWILPTAPHPTTGMTCEFLSMIAMRGDLKKRRTAGWELGVNSPENLRKVAEEYRSQYEELRAAHTLEQMGI